MLAAGSVVVTHRGPTMVTTCNVTPDRCPQPALHAGWPAPFMTDDPNVSVPGQIGLGEDHFAWGPFVADVAFYALILALVIRLARRWRAALRRRR